MRRLSLLPHGPYLPTASELHRARECVAVWAYGLPESDDAPGEWATMGRELHGHAESIVLDGVSPYDLAYSVDSHCALMCHVADAIIGDRPLAKSFVWPDGKPDGLRAEQGIKWRSDGFADEAALCKRAPGERLQGWFSGTADLVYVRTDGVLVVADWKFGPRAKYIDAKAKNHAQGWFLALAFTTLLEITGSSDEVIVARFEARYVGADGIDVDGIDITWGEICEWRDTLAGLAKRIEMQEDALPRITAACDRCKAKAACPAQTALEVELLARASSDALALDGPPQTAEEARQYSIVIDKLKAMLEEVKERYGAYLVLNKEGVPVGLGMREVGKRVERPALAASDTCTARIRERFGEAAFASKPSLGRIEASVKTKEGIKSKADWDKRRVALREDLRAEGILLAPTTHTRIIVQRMAAGKWVDVKSVDDEESEE
jgi:hypothetical protein